MIKYWVWLALSLDIGSSHLKHLLQRFGSPDVIYATPISELKATFILSNSELEKLSNKSFAKTNNILSQCEESDIRIIPYTDNMYPESLKYIINPPAVLYVKGKLPNLSIMPTVSIVGSRKISSHGRLAAWSLAGRLALSGMIIVSGGALGADTAAHEGAIAVGGKTVAVLPCGINYNYLKTNEFLRKTIEDNGCLISELPPLEPLHKNAFHIRNRLLSALSLGVIIVEAGCKSGSLITARHAIDQGREVFVVTGKAGDKAYAGSNELIRDGAKPVFTADDVFIEYINRYTNIIDIEKAKKTSLEKIYRTFNSPAFCDDCYLNAQKDEDNSNAIKKIKKKIDETLPKNVQIVYNYIDNDVVTVDDLLTCGLPFEEILSAVTQLEIYGYIKAIPGGRYSVVY